jgi:hypothetical protein
MRKRTLLQLALPLTVVLFLVLMVRSAGAHPDSMDGGASGATAESGKTRVGPTPQVVMPRRGGEVFTEAPRLNVPDVISTGPLTALTGGGVGTRDTTVQSVSTVENVSLLGGRIRADFVVAIASSAGNGATAASDAAGTEVVNLVVDGVSKGNVTGTNVGIPIPGGTLVVNEQTVSGDGSNESSISVNALRLILRDAWTWTVTDDIRVGSASSSVAASSFVPAHPLPEECVFYTGGGRIDRLPHQSNQDFATFGFNATMRNTADCKGPSGQLQYVDHFRRFKFHGKTADIVGESEDFEFGGRCAEISGEGRFSVDNGPWTPSSYRAMVCDNGEPGVGRDKFMIEVSGAGYSSLAEGKGPILKGGNIQRHS